jgi:hypothetical protein
MAPGCSLTCERLARRVAGSSTATDPTAAELYATCHACAEVLTCLDPALRRRLGYAVTSATAAATVPFYWRQNRWVFLDAAGGLSETSTGHDRIANRSEHHRETFACLPR